MVGRLACMSGQARAGAVSAYRERNSTADRALEILAMYSEELPVLSGAEVASRLGVARSTAYRYLQSLVASRFLEDAPGGGFRLGMRVLELARLARRSHGLLEIAAPVMSDLAEAVNETTLLTRRIGGIVVCLHRVESRVNPVRISYEPGSTFPLNAGASALALLAWADRHEVRGLLQAAHLRRFTPATLTSVDSVLDRLERIRADGYAVTKSELDHDVLGIAAPIYSDAGAVIAAVSVAALASRVSRKRERDIIKQVRAAAAAISDHVALIDT